MGLYATIDLVKDWGLPTSTPNYGLPIDYSSVVDVFRDTFLEVAYSLVPVDTGYLKSTISAEGDGYMLVAQATAEYAQYVEYGTYKMEAQPYFEPAFEAASQQAYWEANQVYANAQDTENIQFGEEMQDNGSRWLSGISEQNIDICMWCWGIMIGVLVDALLQLLITFIEDIFDEVDDV